jgi:hypothetical protein
MIQREYAVTTCSSSRNRTVPALLGVGRPRTRTEREHYIVANSCISIRTGSAGRAMSAAGGVHHQQYHSTRVNGSYTKCSDE